MFKTKAPVDPSEAADPYVLRKHDRSRWTRLWRAALVAVLTDLLITAGLFWASDRAVKQANYNGKALRASQYSACETNNRRARAQIDYQAYVLAQQRKSLQDIKKLPDFNTPEIRKLALENQQRQIQQSEKFLEAFQLTDCLRLFGVDGKPPTLK